MKFFILTLSILFSGLQAEAVVACRHVETPCNVEGHKYLCHSFGWGGEGNPFCSESDVGISHNVKLEINTATILCEYRAERCNSSNDHYSCVRMGTVGQHASVCSPTDISTAPPHDLSECEARCLNGGRSPGVCNHYCNW